MLQFPVLVEIEKDRGGRVALDGFTLSVSAHGALVEVSLPLRAGQRLFLVQPATGLRQSCKTVGLRRSDDGGGFLVAFEFDRPAPEFWPITLPPKDWERDKD